MKADLFRDLSDLPDADPAESAAPSPLPAVREPEPPAPAGNLLDADLSEAEDAAEEDLQQLDAASAQQARLRRPVELPRFPVGRLFLLALAGLAVIFMAREVYQFAAETFAFDVSLGWVSLGLLVALAAMILWAVLREIRAYRRLSQCERLRESCRACRADPDDARAETELMTELGALLTAFEENGPEDLRARVQQLRLGVGTEPEAGDWLAAVEDRLLKPMDEEAHEIIQREAVNVGLGTAISPYGFLDATLALWRNVRMVRRVAEIYQVRPGVVGTYVILRRALAAVVLADLAQEASTALLGAFRGIATLISPIGQGLTNATLTIRLGLLAQTECRPLPLPPERSRGTASLLTRAVPAQIKRQLRKSRESGDETKE